MPDDGLVDVLELFLVESRDPLDQRQPLRIVIALVDQGF